MQEQTRLAGNPALITLEINAEQAEVFLFGQIQGPFFPTAAPIVGFEDEAVTAHQKAMVGISEGHVQGIGLGSDGHLLPRTGRSGGQARGHTTTQAQAQADHHDKAEQLAKNGSH